MNNLMIFEDKQVEVFEFNGKILFNPYHCGNCLGISNEGVRKAITRMNENQVIKLNNSIVTDSHIRKLHNTGENFLTESGVYKLIFKSKKEEAEKFQDWVTDEVLPSIRKTGGYIHTTEDMSDDEIMARALQVAQKTIEKKSREIEEKDKVIQLQQPKVLFADSVASSDNSILVGELAKLL
uniref:BRO family protein n=1 Tax=Clostridioides difficile TaxID=1496 RepID=UPI0020B15BD7